MRKPCGNVLNHQTIKALPACELVNETSLLGIFHAGIALNV